MVARSASPHQPVVDWLAAPQTRTPLAFAAIAGFAGCDAALLYQSSLDCALPLALNWQLPMGRFRTRLTMPLRPQVTFRRLQSGWTAQAVTWGAQGA